MNTIPENDGLCLRCGEDLLPEELALGSEGLCACCEQMRCEALQIYAEKLNSLSRKAVMPHLPNISVFLKRLAGRPHAHAVRVPGVLLRAGNCLQVASHA